MPVTFSRDGRSRFASVCGEEHSIYAIISLVWGSCFGVCHPVAIILNCGLSVNKMVSPFEHSGCKGYTNKEISIYENTLSFLHMLDRNN